MNRVVVLAGLLTVVAVTAAAAPAEAAYAYACVERVPCLGPAWTPNFDQVGCKNVAVTFPLVGTTIVIVCA